MNDVAINEINTGETSQDSITYVSGENNEYTLTAAQTNKKNHTVTFSALGHDGAVGSSALDVHFDDRHDEKEYYVFERWNNVSDSQLTPVVSTYSGTMDIANADLTHAMISRLHIILSL